MKKILLIFALILTLCAACFAFTACGDEECAHSYSSEVTKEATCVSDGVMTYTCSLCSDSYTEVIKALDHDEVSHEAKAPTCTEIGWDAYVTCSRHDYSTFAPIEEKGHTAKAAVEEKRVNATCTKEGKYDEVIYCSVCNTELAREAKTIDKLPHVYVNRACECGLIELITLKELKVNIEKYVDTYVAFEGVVVKNTGDTAYVEEYDEETGEYFGMQIYYGYSLSMGGMEVLSIGNRIVVVGTVLYFEAGGIYQICNIRYDPYDPQDPKNIKLIEAGHSASYDEATVSEITTGKLNATVNEVTGERRDFDFGYLTLHSSKKLTNLTVESVYTTSNGGMNDGAHFISCRDIAGNRIIIRTAVLYDENYNPLPKSYFEGKVILETCGIIDAYDGEYQLKVFHQDNIIFK